MKIDKSIHATVCEAIVELRDNQQANIPVEQGWRFYTLLELPTRFKANLPSRGVIRNESHTLLNAAIQHELHWGKGI